MDANSENRLSRGVTYPNYVYLEALGLFFLGNFVFHQRVFRNTNNKYQFFGFLIANASTSW